MNVTLNGQPTELVAELVLDLLKERGIDPEKRGVAVAVNERVIPKARWSSEVLREGDRIEIITAMQGG